MAKLKWLSKQPPMAGGVTWGVPWKKRGLKKRRVTDTFGFTGK
ncbi:hypothetical protein [Bacillus atrophaeus]